MYVSKDFILEQLPAFKNKRVVISRDQDVKDIIRLMLAAHKENEPLYDKIGKYFIGETIDETCNNLYSFCKENLRYDEESDKLQTVQVPQGLLTAGHCDCKGFASFICGCLAAIQRSGVPVKWNYCFASYKLLKKTPYHVFSVVETDSGPIWVDPTPGANGKSPVWWVNKTVKRIGMLEQVIGKINDDEGGGYSVGLLRPGGNGSNIPELYQAQQDLAASVLLSSQSAGAAVSNSPAITTPVFPKPVEAKAIIENVVPVPAPEPNEVLASMGLPITNKQLFIGLGGLVALYFLTKGRSAETVSGVLGKKKDKNLIPIVIGLGALGYWWYTKQSALPAVVLPPLADAGVQLQPPATSGGTTVTYQPPIQAPPDVIQTTALTAAQLDKEALERTFPQYQPIYLQMSDSEIIAMYNYMFGYVIQGLKLYAGPGATGIYPDGNWNAILYNQMAAIRTKYNINI